MAAPSRPFLVEPDDDPVDAALQAPAAPQPRVQRVSTDMLVMALKALSQRALVALLQLFTLITVGSAFFLWMSTPDPNVHQIVSLSIYGSLVLAINWLVYLRRK